MGNGTFFRQVCKIAIWRDWAVAERKCICERSERQMTSLYFWETEGRARHFNNSKMERKGAKLFFSTLLANLSVWVLHKRRIFHPLLVHSTMPLVGGKAKEEQQCRANFPITRSLVLSWEPDWMKYDSMVGVYLTRLHLHLELQESRKVSSFWHLKRNGR